MVELAHSHDPESERELEAIAEGVRFSRWLDFSRDVDSEFATGELANDFSDTQAYVDSIIGHTHLKFNYGALLNLAIAGQEARYGFLAQPEAVALSSEDAVDAAWLLRDNDPQLRQALIKLALWNYLHEKLFDAAYKHATDRISDEDALNAVRQCKAFAQQHVLYAQGEDGVLGQPDFGLITEAIDEMYAFAAKFCDDALEEEAHRFETYLLSRHTDSPEGEKWERRPAKMAREEYIKALTQGGLSFFHSEWKILYDTMRGYQNGPGNSPEITPEQFVGYVNRRMIVNDLHEHGKSALQQYWPVANIPEVNATAEALCTGERLEQAERLVRLRGVCEQIFDHVYSICRVDPKNLDYDTLFAAKGNLMREALCDLELPDNSIDLAVRAAFDEAVMMVSKVKSLNGRL